MATTYGGGITGLGNETIVLTDTTLAAATLTPTVNGYSTVAINANSVATLTGTNAEIIAAYDADTASTVILDGDVDIDGIR